MSNKNMIRTILLITLLTLLFAFTITTTKFTIDVTKDYVTSQIDGTQLLSYESFTSQVIKSIFISLVKHILFFIVFSVIIKSLFNIVDYVVDKGKKDWNSIIPIESSNDFWKIFADENTMINGGEGYGKDTCINTLIDYIGTFSMEKTLIIDQYSEIENTAKQYSHNVIPMESVYSDIYNSNKLFTIIPFVQSRRFIPEEEEETEELLFRICMFATKNDFKTIILDSNALLKAMVSDFINDRYFFNKIFTDIKFIVIDGTYDPLDKLIEANINLKTLFPNLILFNHQQPEINKIDKLTSSKNHKLGNLKRNQCIVHNQKNAFNIDMTNINLNRIG